MVSMMEAIAADHSDLEAHYVHGTVCSDTHAMDAHVRALAKGHGNISVTTFYSQPHANDQLGETHDGEGFVSVDWLARTTPLHDADVYLCGPKPFLRSFVSGLALAGVPADRIHYEFFGPADELMAA
jgi:nitric oxide dioxygenase